VVIPTAGFVPPGGNSDVGCRGVQMRTSECRKLANCAVHCFYRRKSLLRAAGSGRFFPSALPIWAVKPTRRLYRAGWELSDTNTQFRYILAVFVRGRAAPGCFFGRSRRGNKITVSQESGLVEKEKGMIKLQLPGKEQREIERERAPKIFARARIAGLDNWRQMPRVSESGETK